MNDKTKRKDRRTRSGHVIRFYSKKNECAVVTYSHEELLFALRLERDAYVTRFASQPESMFINIDGKRSRYSPDFLVQYYDGQSKYIEVHHEHFTDEAYLTKLAHFNKFVKQTRGIPIEVIIVDGFNEVELANYELISNCRSIHLSFDVLDLIFPPKLTFGGLINGLTPYSVDPVADSYHLIANGMFSFETTAPLTTTSALTLQVNC